MNFTDEYFMKMAFLEAQKALEKNEVPVGAVVVLNNAIIAKGHNLTQTLNDVTAHAEMQTITAATNHLGAKYLNDCTLYVTLEPCVMCAGASFWTQISRVVYGAEDIKRGYSLLSSSVLHPRTKVSKGVMADECGALMKDFFRKKR